MRATLESTDYIVTVNGVPGRVWEGTTESGARFFALITRVAVHKEDDNSQFERELRECRPASPQAPVVFPLRMVL